MIWNAFQSNQVGNLFIFECLWLVEAIEETKAKARSDNYNYLLFSISRSFFALRRGKEANKRKTGSVIVEAHHQELRLLDR